MNRSSSSVRSISPFVFFRSSSFLSTAYNQPRCVFYSSKAKKVSNKDDAGTPVLAPTFLAMMPMRLGPLAPIFNAPKLPVIQLHSTFAILPTSVRRALRNQSERSAAPVLLKEEENAKSIPITRDNTL